MLTSYQGLGEVYQGSNKIGEFRYELSLIEKDRRVGVLYVGNKVPTLSSLSRKELVLLLEDGATCNFQITGFGTKMGIKIIGPIVH